MIFLLIDCLNELSSAVEELINVLYMYLVSKAILFDKKNQIELNIGKIQINKKSEH